MEQIHIYQGYESDNLDNISIKNFKAFLVYLRKHLSYYENTNFNAMISSLESMPIPQIQELAKSFLEQHFDIHPVSYLSIEDASANTSYVSNVTNATEFYGRVNSLLKDISPYDLPIQLVSGHSMTGQIVKPLICTPDDLLNKDRKIYFSHIEIGKQVTALSAATLVHEIAHSQQEQIIGYTRDYLNKEIISIFLEKVAALELDPTGRVLKVSESIRANDLVCRYANMMGSKLLEKEQLDHLLYIKSILFAQKLFDMYLSERKFKRREEFFTQIQSVFDGHLTVDEMIAKRNITYSQCLDVSLLERRMGK